MAFVETTRGRFYYEEHGAGEPLLFVTGLNGVAAHWSPQIEGFASHYRVIIFDQRGCGQSEPPPDPCSIEELADDTLCLLDALEIESAHLVGHSAGGAIGQVIALGHSHRLRKLVLASSWARSDEFFRRMMRLRRDLLVDCGAGPYVRAGAVFLYPPAWVNAHQKELAAADARLTEAFTKPEVVRARIDAVLAFDRAEEIASIRVPTLVIVAENDILTPPHLSEELVSAIPSAQLSVLPDGAHMFTLLSAQEFNQRILEFLNNDTA